MLAGEGPHAAAGPGKKGGERCVGGEEGRLRRVDGVGARTPVGVVVVGELGAATERAAGLDDDNGERAPGEAGGVGSAGGVIACS